jgi:Arc/MetJ-type ribon-helix-helix transcriptional regulator
MELSLPPQLEDFVQQMVRSGRYLDEQEVVRDALRQMRAVVRSGEDPSLIGLVRDALGLASQAQRDVTSMMQAADRETTVFGEVLGHASAVTNAAFDVMRKVPGAREVEKVVRVPLDGVMFAAQQGEANARVMRTNLEATSKALGMLTAVLERVNAASRSVNNVISPPN